MIKFWQEASEARVVIHLANCILYGARGYYRCMQCFRLCTMFIISWSIMFGCDKSVRYTLQVVSNSCKVGLNLLKYWVGTLTFFI